jgi:calcineurin-like phosphoesterase family protein
MFNNLTKILILITASSMWLVPAITYSAHADPEAAGILEQLEGNRRLIVAENMNVEEAAEADFWAVYDAYRLEIGALDAEGFKLLGEFRDHFDELTDDRAGNVLSSYFRLEQEILAVRQAYIGKFSAVISPKQTLRFYQIENKLDAIIHADISAVTPLVD